MTKFMCQWLGHKRIQAFDGSARCARCKVKLQNGFVDAMREVDPEWYAEYQDAPAGVAFEAFEQRNPGILV